LGLRGDTEELPLTSEIKIRPAYAEGFQCIGSACEDTCCQAWTVPVDQSTYEKYQALPDGPLRVLVNASVVRTEECAGVGSGAGNSRPYAAIRMNETNACPLLTEERLCRVQRELGAEMLSHTCATYPRIVSTVGGVEEKVLAFSCPEAVRVALRAPQLLLRMESSDAAGDARSTVLHSIHEDFWATRGLVVRLARNRSYPLWQRLFLMKILTERLDAVEHAEGKRDENGRTAPEFLADFEKAVRMGSLRSSMETLPVDRNAQLDIVLRLAGLMLHKSMMTPRFHQCVQAFTSGIGNGPGATLESLAANYAVAHDSYYAPFFERNPHMMENILLNTIFRCQFPFGKDGARAGAKPDMSREFAQLTAQFTLIRGLLIGVAGHYGAEFSEAHVVHTLQAASKHFEHHPEFLNMAHALLVESGMDGARGLAILLRNVDSQRESNESVKPSIAPATIRSTGVLPKILLN
jgi:lysine-N-methylase